jgi:hypothetical protein
MVIGFYCKSGLTERRRLLRVICQLYVVDN